MPDTRIDPKRSFSMLELLLVVTILSIVAAIALPNYTKAREHALGREAIANLKIIAAAERIIKLETGNYEACVSTANCNSDLNLDLSGNNWTYTVGLFSGGFEAFADRISGPYASCIYRLASTFANGEPVVAGGTCP